MTRWRPDPAIKVKVLGLAERDGALLFAEVTDDSGHVKGLRPLGGSVEFGETREQALVREFREELGAEVEITSPWTVFENIYEHEGQLGHEVVFIAHINLPDGVANKESLRIHDSIGVTARWWRLAEAEQHGLAIYPKGLKAFLAVGTVLGKR